MSRRPRTPLDETRSARLREAQELDAEIEAHIAHRVDDLTAEGLSPQDARARALGEFGDAARIKQESLAAREAERRRAARSSRFEAARQDLAYAFRQLRHGPGFALTALLTLTLGVGATVTIASVVEAVVFEPLPFQAPERVVFVEMLTPEGARFSVSEPVYLDWSRELQTLQGVAATHTEAGTLRSPGEPRSIDVGRISHTLLDVLGVEPALGRTLRPAEDLPAMGAPVAMISHAMWRQAFGEDPEVLGTPLEIDGRSYEIVGVMPADLDVLAGDTPVFVPMGADPGLDREDHYLSVLARLAPGVTIEEAQAELSRVQTDLSERHRADLGWGTRITPARDLLIGETVERAGWILLAAAGVLLVMACVNVSNLLMVRSTTRRTEMALRTALGASQGRLIRQLFTESALLAAAGGAMGVVLAGTALPLVRTLGSARIPRLETAHVDGAALLAGLAAVAVATLSCGLAPVFQLRRDRLSSAMSGRSSAHDPGGRVRSAMVAAQVALTVVLLSGTGLLLRSFVELTGVDPGFTPEGTLAFSMDMPDGSWSWEERAQLVPQIRDAVQAIPAVTAVGATAVEPFSGSALANFVAAEGDIPDRASDFTPIHWRVVTPGFFEAMGMEMVAGRDFRDGDDWENGTPVVIGRSLADALWGASNPLGRRLVWGDPEGSRMTVIGVVGDLRDVELGEVPSPIVYRPHRQIPWAVMTMVVRYEGEPSQVTAAIRRAVPETLPGLPVGEIEPLSENMRRAVAEPRFNLQLLSAFAAVGLLLALVGVYGLTAFDVRRRFPEIGIRLSLGARPEEIRRMILGQRLRLTVLGVAMGLVAAWLTSGALRALLYGVAPNDPLTWIVVVAVVLGASLLATYLPARKATEVEPSAVLHGE